MTNSNFGEIELYIFELESDSPEIERFTQRYKSKLLLQVEVVTPGVLVVPTGHVVCVLRGI